jgi:hypothetical protein
MDEEAGVEKIEEAEKMAIAEARKRKRLVWLKEEEIKEATDQEILFWLRIEEQNRETAKRWRKEQERTEEWRKSEAEKVRRAAERYTGGQVGVEKWLISHL